MGDTESRGRPVDQLMEIDLDVGLTPEEREIVAATPFYGLAKTLAAMFAIFVLILLSGRHIAQARDQRAQVRGVAERIEMQQAALPGATPVKVVEIGQEWMALQRSIRSLPMSEQKRIALAQSAVSAGEAFLERSAEHLQGIEYLTTTEAANIANMMGLVADSLATGAGISKYRTVLDRAIDVITQDVVSLAGPSASAQDLRRGAGLLFRVASVVEPAHRVEYTETARALLDRALVTEQRGAAMATTDPASPNIRAELASIIHTSLLGEGSPIIRVVAEGSEAHTLLVEGWAPIEGLVDLILSGGDMRQRLLSVGFTTLLVLGTDGRAVIDIETLEPRGI